MNLVENAVKYSPDGGRIVVRVEPAARMVRFTVADEGLGIPAGAGAHLREVPPPRPGDDARRRWHGLGLYICRELVLRMNGRIWVTSEPGRGSTFSVELPRAAATDPPAGGGVRSPRADEGRYVQQLRKGTSMRLRLGCCAPAWPTLLLASAFAGGWKWDRLLG